MMFNRYVKDERGQFAIMFALFSTMLLGGLMVAIDMNNLVTTKSKVSAITDAAALAGANAFDSTDRMNVVEEFLKANGYEMLPAKFVGKPTIKFNDEAGDVTVSVDTSVALPFAAMFGNKSKDVGYTSVAAYPDRMDPLTIAFALDISGSMGWGTPDGQIKINALKNATSNMFDIIEAKVKNKESIDKYIRTGVSAFHSTLAVDEDMDWGFEHARTTINGLNAGGGTNTFAALENAHKQILDDRMYRISHDPTFKLSTLDEFVIFMTDGENTAGDPVVLDEDSYETCIAMRDDGIEVFAIAFTAPARGQLLMLDCASWDKATEDIRSGSTHNRKKGCKIIAGIAGAMPNVKGLQNALEKCQAKNGADKKEHYYDAADAKSFEEIFKVIADKINESAVRIKS